MLIAGLLLVSPRLQPRLRHRRRPDGPWIRWVDGLGRRVQAPLVCLAPSCQRYSSRQIAIGSALVLIVMVVVPPLGGALALAAVAGPVGHARRHRRRRRQELERQLPDAIDQLGLAVGSGLPLPQALAVATRWCPEAYRPLFAAVLDQTRGGVSLVDALRSLARSVEPVGRRPWAVIIAAVRDGTPLAASLAQAADEAREQRQRQIELRARRLPVLMLLPLVACVLPAFVLLTIVPLVVVSLRDVQIGGL